MRFARGLLSVSLAWPPGTRGIPVITRGDGGQNILGPKTGNALVVLRTQELLASRRVDGAEQFFDRRGRDGRPRRLATTRDAA